MVTKPIGGAQKEGFAGLVKGLGKGIIGTVVKPVDKVTLPLLCLYCVESPSPYLSVWSGCLVSGFGILRRDRDETANEMQKFQTQKTTNALGQQRQNTVSTLQDKRTIIDYCNP